MGKIKIDSFSTAFFTPVKVDNQERMVSPDKMEAGPIMDSVQMFLRSGEISFCKLEDMKMTQDTVKEIETFFLELQPDVPDEIMKQEETAILEKTFTEQKKRYLAEEFHIAGEYSYSAMCVLCYSLVNELSIKESGGKLFGRDVINESLHLNDKDISCDLVDERLTRDYKSDLISYTGDKEESYISDDSFKDADYKPPVNGIDISSSENSDLEDSSLIDASKHGDVFEFHDEEQDNVKICNPFCKVKKTTGHSNSIVNSRFKSINNVSKCLFLKDLSPIRKTELNIRLSKCDHCGKEFSKKNNLKRHIVSVHKIYPKGMTIYECPVKDCTFVSDNQTHFNRHRHGKSVKTNLEKIVCRQCDNSFFNHGSLKRHIKRKHSS